MHTEICVCIQDMGLAVLREQLDSTVSKGFPKLNNSEIPKATPALSPATKILPCKPNTISYSIGWWSASSKIFSKINVLFIILP